MKTGYADHREKSQCLSLPVKAQIGTTSMHAKRCIRIKNAYTLWNNNSPSRNVFYRYACAKDRYPASFLGSLLVAAKYHKQPIIYLQG